MNNLKKSLNLFKYLIIDFIIFIVMLLIPLSSANKTFGYSEPIWDFDLSSYIDNFQSTLPSFNFDYFGSLAYQQGSVDYSGYYTSLKNTSFYALNYLPTAASNYLFNFDNYSTNRVGNSNTFLSSGITPSFDLFSPVLPIFADPFLFFDPTASFFSSLIISPWINPYPSWQVPIVDWFTPYPTPKSSTTKETPTGEPRKLFAMEYNNWAWGYQHSGFYIDTEGNLYTVDGEYVKTISPIVLAEKKSLIKAASEGTYSERKNTAYDMGTTVYSCYLYNTSTGENEEIVLAQNGDWTYKNESQAAASLVAWLSTISY